jgi:hypothetical protein
MIRMRYCSSTFSRTSSTRSGYLFSEALVCKVVINSKKTRTVQVSKISIMMRVSKSGGVTPTILNHWRVARMSLTMCVTDFPSCSLSFYDSSLSSAFPPFLCLRDCYVVSWLLCSCEPSSLLSMACNRKQSLLNPNRETGN